MTIRGCAYAGSKGVVWGPIKDMVHISHGPVGCGQYSWAARRNYYIGTTGIDTFVTMQFTSDFQEKDIVFGGDKKLDKIIDEIQELFPLNKGISIQSECPIGLIGDDIEAVSKKKSQGIRRQDHRAGALRRFPRRVAVARPPHRQRRDPRLGVRQGRPEQAPRLRSTPYDVAIIGDYNIGGDAWSQPHPAGRNGPARDRPVVRRRHHRRNGKHAQGQAQRAALLPLDELHQPPHGREVRHSLGGIQLLRPDQDRRVAARDRQPLRRHHQGKAPSA